eukprot:551549_1
MLTNRIRQNALFICALLIQTLFFIIYLISSNNVNQIFIGDNIDKNEFLDQYIDFIDDFSNIPVVNKHPTQYVFDNKLIQDKDEDLWLEFGVYSGRAINVIAAYTDVENKIYGFDSFEGLPEKWMREDTNQFDKGTFSLKGKLPNVKANVQLIKGLFDKSIPKFITDVIEKEGRKISYIHIDCDLYSSTKTIFELLPKYIKKDAIFDFDELINYDGYFKHEAKAFFEFVQKNNVTYQWIAMKNKIGSRGKESEEVAVRIISTKWNL